jgi:hypothetical protein
MRSDNSTAFACESVSINNKATRPAILHVYLFIVNHSFQREWIVDYDPFDGGS